MFLAPRFVLLLPLVCTVLEGASFAAESDVITEIEVVGQRRDGGMASNIDPRHVAVTTNDMADLITYVPGAAVTTNGPLAGQVQYRGLGGPRVKVQLDGMYLSSGGPNLMDPPLHYMPEPILSNLSVVRGIAPVSAGSSIGGTVKAKAKSSDFGDGDTMEIQADLSASYRSVNNGYATGGLIGAGNDRFRFHVLGSMEEGDQTKFDGGKITPTDFERAVYGGGAGTRIGDHEFGIDFRHHKTDHAGNPSLPMDTQLFDTDITNFTYKGDWGFATVDGQVYYTHIDHEMDNFSFRTPPMNPMMYRFVDAKGEGVGFKLAAGWNAGNGRLSIGVDGHYAENSMDIFNPNMAMFFVNNINKAGKDSTGAYIEWEGGLGEFDMQIGARFTHVATDAQNVAVAPMLPMGAHMLAAAFNASDRSRADDNVDVVARFSYPVSERLKLTLAAGRKTRSPFYIERYAWLPIEASAGLADGNNYIGDVTLEPEVAWEMDAGFDWETGGGYFTPRVFYRRIDDYIQGVPIDMMTNPMAVMVSTMNGDSTPLRFANVEAEIYGLDAGWGLMLGEHFHIDGIFTFVRAKRRDTSDDLYRITPLRATGAITYMRDDWSITTELVGVAKQKKVSAANNEQPSSGYGLINVHGEWQVTDNVSLLAGVENVLDDRYEDHLAGFNRIAGSDLAVGERLPGDGRNAFVRLTFIY